MRITKKMWRNLWKRVHQLECPHDGDVKFDVVGRTINTIYGGIVNPDYVQKCEICGKVLKDYGSECAWLKDKAAYLTKLAKECEKEQP